MAMPVGFTKNPPCPVDLTCGDLRIGLSHLSCNKGWCCPLGLILNYLYGFWRHGDIKVANMSEVMTEKDVDVSLFGVFFMIFNYKTTSTGILLHSNIVTMLYIQLLRMF